jgi:integrase
VTVLPDSLKTPLQEHLKGVKILHDNDLANGYGRVYLPFALERKYPFANQQWGWQYVFPSKSLSKDPRTGEVRRHHVNESSLQKAVKKAVSLAGINKPVNCAENQRMRQFEAERSEHTFRHCFATHLLEACP